MDCEKDIKFTVNRDEQGVSGFTLFGLGDTYAESYCLSFLTAQASGKGKVTFGDGKIIFTHGGVPPKEANKSYDVWGVSGGGVFEAAISSEDKEDLSQLLAQSGKYSGAQIRARPEMAWGKGFTLYIKR